MCRSAKGRKSPPQLMSSRRWRSGCGESGRWARSPPISSRLRESDGMVPDFLTIAEAGALIGKRELSPVELTESRLARIERLDGKLHSFIRVLREPALTAARAAEAEIMAGNRRGPLHGIPIGLKDIYETKGVPTTGHSKILIDHVPQQDATSVRRLTDAGAIVVGKLATHEFALGGPSFDLPWPPARNPWDTTRFTGGSSSGTGAAVPAGLVLGGTGSDTCRSPFHSTMPGQWLGPLRIAPSCCRRWRVTTQPIRRAPRLPSRISARR